MSRPPLVLSGWSTNPSVFYRHDAAYATSSQQPKCQRTFSQQPLLQQSFSKAKAKANASSRSGGLVCHIRPELIPYSDDVVGTRIALIVERVDTISCNNGHKLSSQFTDRNHFSTGDECFFNAETITVIIIHQLETSQEGSGLLLCSLVRWTREYN